jgi:hypothetical protein
LVRLIDFPLARPQHRRWASRPDRRERNSRGYELPHVPNDGFHLWDQAIRGSWLSGCLAGITLLTFVPSAQAQFREQRQRPSPASLASRPLGVALRIHLFSSKATQRHLSEIAHQLSPPSTLYVRLCPHSAHTYVRSCSAPSRGSGATTLMTIAPEHTAQREPAIAASRSFVAT